MPDRKNSPDELFDPWPDKYDRWFETPIGRVVKHYETDLLMEFLRPEKGEKILDAGCGTGIFTRDMLLSGACVTGLDISKPMLKRAAERFAGLDFEAVAGDMTTLPFADETFDKTVSVTAIEFLEDGKKAVEELFRVTRTGGPVVVTTLNSLSPWAARRRQAAGEGHKLFQHVFFRSPEEMALLMPGSCKVKTAIHFLKTDAPQKAVDIEKAGREKSLMTGAFLAAVGVKG